nr:sensor domain-containing diguanylate cyclase [Fimbriimonadaceae bacterium]
MAKRKPVDLTLNLRKSGIKATELNPEHPLTGFPIKLSEPSGGESLVWLENMPLAGSDEVALGVGWLATSDGVVVSSWGEDKNFPKKPVLGDHLHNGLRELLRKALRIGHASIFIDGYRVYASRVRDVTTKLVVFLACDAGDEAQARRNAALSARQVDALKRIGRSLSMSQTLQPLVLSAAHTICDALGLAGAMLWVKAGDDLPLELVSSVGIDRQGTQHITTLDIDTSIDTLAELSVSLGKTVVLSRIEDSPLGHSFESRWCYARVGGVFVTPLTIQSKLLGVLELIGRRDDDAFSHSLDVMEAVAEQLAMALNGAIMFEGVEKLATIDPLTGISNHRTMQQFLARRTQEAERSQGTLGVIMVDVDHFRNFNEEEGHDAGDKVLRMVADVLKQSLRPYDLAARYGGEEFTLILPNVHKEQLIHISERIRQNLMQLVYVGSSGRIRHLSASFGCALYPESANEPASLLKAADVALYQAKN